MSRRSAFGSGDNSFFCFGICRGARRTLSPTPGALSAYRGLARIMIADASLFNGASSCVAHLGAPCGVSVSMATASVVPRVPHVNAQSNSRSAAFSGDLLCICGNHRCWRRGRPQALRAADGGAGSIRRQALDNSPAWPMEDSNGNKQGVLRRANVKRHLVASWA